MLFNYVDIVFNLYAAINRRKKAANEGSNPVSVSPSFLQAAEEKERLDQLIDRSAD